MPRAWLYSQITGDASTLAMIPGGMHASTSLEKTPELKPFIMFRLSAHRPGNRGDDVDVDRLESYQLFVHDVPGDYLQIDSIIKRLKDLLVNVKDPAAGISRVIWLEDSEDFRDEDMGTILRYARIQIRYRPGGAS